MQLWTESEIDTLRFVGRVRDGAGQYSILELPGQTKIGGRVRDWPDQLQAGSLNVQVDAHGFPSRFVEAFGSTSIWNLDTRRFRPEAELDWDDIANNTLRPTRDQPDRGRPQVWRAHLTKIDSGDTVQCWVVRRRYSRMRRDTFECVAGVRLRDALSLENGDQVELIIEGIWQ
jgi:hypothetical protein